MHQAQIILVFNRILRIGPALLALAIAGSGVARGQETIDNELQNCVDRSILEYSKLMGKDLSRGDLARTLDLLGMERTLRNRSLADCRRILDALGLPVDAIRLKPGPGARLSTSGIVYLPGGEAGEIGHVVVVEPEPGGSYRVIDTVDDKRNGQIRSLEDLVKRETVVMIPHRAFRGDSLKSGLFTLLVCATLGLGLALALPFRHRLSGGWKRLRGVARPVLFLLASLFLASCNAPEDESGLKVSELEHDFGQVTVESQSSLLQHTFQFLNQSNKEIKISASPASCGCMVAKGNFENVLIGPGRTIDMPVQLNTSFKTGKFRETILIRTSDPRLTDLVIALTGFVQRMPKAAAPRVVLRYDRNGVAKGEALVSYVRPDAGPPAALDGYGLTTAPNADPADMARFSFEVAKPQVSEANSGIGSVTETLRFPIRLTVSGPRTAAAAKLSVAYKVPRADVEIELLAEPLAAIEVFRNRITLAPIAKGATHVESIPIRIHDVEVVNKAKLISDGRTITARLDVPAKRLVLSVHPEASGPISGTVRIESENQPPIQLEVRGHAN